MKKHRRRVGTYGRRDFTRRKILTFLGIYFVEINATENSRREKTSSLSVRSILHETRNHFQYTCRWKQRGKEKTTYELVSPAENPRHFHWCMRTRFFFRSYQLRIFTNYHLCLSKAICGPSLPRLNDFSSAIVRVVEKLISNTQACCTGR